MERERESIRETGKKARVTARAENRIIRRVKAVASARGSFEEEEEMEEEEKRVSDAS